jgi:leader peptidase (prepilin peptidase)/N-methyltransferase
MNQASLLFVVAGVAGVLTGVLIVFFSPRLVAYRLTEPPAMPGLAILIPIVGGWPGHYRPLRTAGLQIILATVFVGLAAHYGDSIRVPLAASYCAMLVAIAYIDIEHRLVLNRLSYPSIVLALGLSLLWPGSGPKNALYGALVALFLFGALELIGRGALGTGDTKLAILIGAMRGIPGVFNALMLGVMMGGVAALFFIVVLQRGRKQYMAYAPYLAAGAVLSFFLTTA